ncbi:MAG: FAD-dependent oxidoreductase [Maricaulaceae bacterium]|jgi:predicted NAD/FAD-binding protein
MTVDVTVDSKRWSERERVVQPLLKPAWRRGKRIAVVGSGAAGLGAAWALRDVHDVTLFERSSRLGGHANTVCVDYDGTRIDVDTGFIVFNVANYPNLTALLDHLGVESRRCDMSFGVSIPGGVEWCSDFRGVFAQKRNLVSPSFISMLFDMARFNREAPRALREGKLSGLTIGDYLRAGRYGAAFRDLYLLPMGAAIWSATTRAMASQPAASVIRFFENHELLAAKRSGWRSIPGGSRRYVDKIAASLGERVRLSTPIAHVRRLSRGVALYDERGREEIFDDVVLACHSNEVRRMVIDLDAEEDAFLGAIGYAPNRAVLHRDASLLPTRPKARASWNYRADEEDAPPSVTYDMNKLQGIDPRYPVYVTLNPLREPAPELVFEEFEYWHPQFDVASAAAQRRFNRVQGRGGLWYAGAWLGYGFHEDALRAGLRVALRLGGTVPWRFVEGDIDGGPWSDDRADHAEARSLAIAP